MFQEFKDEVLDPSLQPDINPRYTIRDNNGKVISDDVQIEMKTPVVQNPTPLNRAVVGNIQGDLYTQDRFNSLEIKQRILEVDYITDIVVRETKHTGNCIPQSGWVSKTEGQYYVYTSNGWQISDNNIGTQTNNAAMAFDGDTTTKFNAKNSTTLCTVTIDCPYPIKITKMKTFLGTGKAQDFESGLIRGYKDGAWVTLYNYGTTYQTSLSEITITNPDYYDKYQVYISTDQLGWAYMAEVQVSEYYTAVFGVRDYYTNLNLPLTSYEKNKKISIEMSNKILDGGNEGEYIETVSNPYLNINTLGEKKINGEIRHGQKYELIYNGESWDILGKIISGTYTGNDATDVGSERSFSLGFRPKFLIMYGYQNAANYNMIFGFVTNEGFVGYNGSGAGEMKWASGYSIPAITDDGFQISGKNSKVSNAFNGFNADSISYKYIAW